MLYSNYDFVRYNNPFNIRVSFSRWLGKVTHQGVDFEQFDTLEHGLRAGFKLIINYYKRGFCTVPSIINRFAPPTENNTRAYINFVVSKYEEYHVPLAPPSDLKMFRLWFFVLCSSMAYFESNYTLSIIEFHRIIDHYHLLDYVPESSQNTKS